MRTGRRVRIGCIIKKSSHLNFSGGALRAVRRLLSGSLAALLVACDDRGVRFLGQESDVYLYQARIILPVVQPFPFGAPQGALFRVVVLLGPLGGVCLACGKAALAVRSGAGPLYLLAAIHLFRKTADVRDGELHFGLQSLRLALSLVLPRGGL